VRVRHNRKSSGSHGDARHPPGATVARLRGAVLAAVKNKPFGWPLKERPSLTPTARDATPARVTVAPGGWFSETSGRPKKTT
jgi:hypothetical protein